MDCKGWIKNRRKSGTLYFFLPDKAVSQNFRRISGEFTGAAENGRRVDLFQTGSGFGAGNTMTGGDGPPWREVLCV